MVKVSIIMCVYNAEDVVKRAIDSVLNQTYKDIELIVVNDGSKDGTRSIIDESALNDNRICAIHKENGGPGKARNTGIDMASGKYIMFIDSDDEYESNMVEEMVTRIEENSYDLVCCGYNNVVYNDDGSTRTSASQKLNKNYMNRTELLKDIDSFLGTWLFNPLWNKIYLSKIIKDNNLKIDETSYMGEDYCFNIDYINLCDKVLIFEDTLYKYTLSKDCLTTKFRENEFELRKPNLIKLEKFYKENKLNKNRLYFEYIMMSYSCFTHLFNKENTNSYKDNLKYIEKVIHSESVNNSLKNFKSSNLVEFISFTILKTKFKRMIYFVSYILYKFTSR